MAKKHIKTLSQATLKESAAKGGCGAKLLVNQLARLLVQLLIRNVKGSPQ